jgi:hypothetical protein
MINEQLLANSTEDFILKYRAAVKAKMTKEQFATLMDIKPKSILRKKQKIKKHIGLDLPYLISNQNLPLDSATLALFEKILADSAEGIIKTERVNSSDNKTTVNIQKNKRYLITAAQNATPIHTGFLKSLQLYCKFNEAELIVIPYRYKNPTSVWNSDNKAQDWWHEAVKPYMIDHELKVGKHIKIMANIKIQPTATSPLSGFDTVTDMDSAIFGHPNVEWKTVPSMPGKMPKVLLTTGAVTQPNYSDSKAGHKGAYHHSYSAVVLEIDSNEMFHVRHVTGDAKGCFYDLNMFYAQTVVETGEKHRALALIAGDIHAEVIDLPTRDALFLNTDSVSNIVNPKHLVLHDLVDSIARNHHMSRDGVGRFVRYIFDKNDNVELGLQTAADFIDLISKPNTKNIVVRSNHDEHVDRWLSEADPKTDPENARFFHYLKFHQYDQLESGNEFNVLEFWCNNPDRTRGLANIENTVFLKRQQSYEVANVELSLHGDMGPNGARGSLRNLSRMGQKLVIGHSHTPGVINGSYQVGTTSKLQLEYNKGPSSWLNTAAVVYPNGTVTLINVIEGKWKI